MSDQSQPKAPDDGHAEVVAIVKNPPRLIGVMRHARVQPADSARGLATTKLYKGEKSSAKRDLAGIGHALAEVLQGPPEDDPEQESEDDRITELVVCHEDTNAARLTAIALTDAYRQAVKTNAWRHAPPVEVKKSELPNPSAYGDGKLVEKWLCNWRTMVRAGPTDSAAGNDLMVIYVGHDPAMSWLADSLLTNDKRQPLGRFQPQVPDLSHTELLVVEPSKAGRYRAAWSLGPPDDSAAKELTDKVKSKMDTAKIFAGVLTAVTTFAANNVRVIPGPHQWWALAGLCLLGFAIILYLITMFFYDALLMPRRFWSGGRPQSGWRRGSSEDLKQSNRLARPPSSGTVLLYQNMVLVWSRVFVPATFVAGLGLASYVFGAARMGTWPRYWIFAGCVFGITAAAILIGRWGRPRLGVSD